MPSRVVIIFQEAGMPRNKKLLLKCAEVEKILNRWATQKGILKPGDEVIVTARIVSTNDARMNLFDFFSRERMSSCGIGDHGYATIRSAVWEIMWLKKPPPPRQMAMDSTRRTTPRFKNMRAFSKKYGDVIDLYRISGLGHRTIRAMVCAMRKARFLITDKNNLIEKYKNK